MMPGRKNIPNFARLLLLAFLAATAAAQSAQSGSATLTVGSTPQQTFKGFGFSITLDDNPWVKGMVNSGNRERFDRETFNDLHVEFVRFWFSPGGRDGLAEFKKAFVTSGAMADARRHGVRWFLLAPGRFPANTEKGKTLSSVDLYAKILAEDIQDMKVHFGVTMDATGLMNEPGAAGEKVVPQALRAALVKAVRRELDRHGLKNVKLIAPETPNCGEDAVEWAKAIEADPAASAALGGFATHSYNMAATPEVAACVRKNGWDYWQTEAGGDREGNTAAARFLNDLNQRVTHWAFFIGPATSPSEQELLSPSAKSFTYYYLQQLTNAFLPGTLMRHTTSSIDGGEMVYTFGQKPHLNAAGGVRPDGKWVIGVVNDASGAKASKISSYYPAEDFDVTVKVPELAGKGAVKCDSCSSHYDNIREKCGKTAVMQSGSLKLHLRPKELITLVSQTAVGN
jgi:hypothetical protein